MSSTLSPDEFRTQIIVPALDVIGMWSPSAEDLLLGTAIQESGLRDIDQAGDTRSGRARGYFQVEPATHDDIWKNYLAYRSGLAAKVNSLLDGSTVTKVVQLERSPKYACAIARIKYLRAPFALPAHGDVAGYAHLWKEVYNTAGGAGTEQEFIDNWHRMVGDAG